MIYLYSFFILLILPLAYFVSFLSKKLRTFFSADRRLSTILSKMNPTRVRRVLFFCSSAGEFEQARPLIDAMKNEFDIHVFFFSPSGIEFAKARKESVSFSLSPIDTVWNWRAIFAKWHPEISIVVRHELWPAFLHVASKESRLVLINYSHTEHPGLFARCLLKNFEKILCIDQQSAATLNFLADHKIQITGDTKADRVFDRAKQKDLVSLPDLYKSEKVRSLVLGSSWEADELVMIPAYQSFTEDTSTQWRLTICPHDISPENLRRLAALVSDFGFIPLFFSQMSGDWDAKKVVIVDKLGILAELYSVAAAAFVGGGSHHKVHNVLEPAAYGCPLAFGPLYKNSPEACHFVEEHSATVVKSIADGLTWLKFVEKSDFRLRKQVLLSAEALRGGTDRILNLLLKK